LALFFVINPAIVFTGQYKVYRIVYGDTTAVKYSGKYDAEFRAAEKLARKEKLNIWGDPELTIIYLRLKSKWGQYEK
jgi:endonuclease YncB( thermonuclease family)